MTGGGLDLLSSRLASALRMGSGGRVGQLGPRPSQPLELWEFEGCPFCRKVREALSILDLEVRVFPCPKRGTRFRPALVRRAGKAQFPYLVDPDAGVEMYESDAILRHLFARYGRGSVPRHLAAGAATDVSAALAGIARLGAGSFQREARAPERPLELYGFEASPGSRLVRERLCELELSYLLHNRAPGTQRALPAGVTRHDLPHLVDPNAGAALSGAAAALRHLEARYAA